MTYQRLYERESRKFDDWFRGEPIPSLVLQRTQIGYFLFIQALGTDLYRKWKDDLLELGELIVALVEAQPKRMKVDHRVYEFIDWNRQDRLYTQEHRDESGDLVNTTQHFCAKLEYIEACLVEGDRESPVDIGQWNKITNKVKKIAERFG